MVDGQEFAELLTLCQLMRGPNIVGSRLCRPKLRRAICAVEPVAGSIRLHRGMLIQHDPAAGPVRGRQGLSPRLVARAPE
jgi:hypothetical protein